MKRFEILILILILAVFNLPLFITGQVSSALIYYPDKVCAGQWWRIITHPFVHISVYHLIIDGLAFVWLWSLLETNLLSKIYYVLASLVAGLLAVSVVLPYNKAVGFCGMSGIDHGLMAVCCLDMLRSTDIVIKRVGLVSLAGLLGKCLYEVITGRMLFEFMHLGSVGVPVVICHIAGVVGALVVYGLLRIKSNPIL